MLARPRRLLIVALMLCAAIPSLLPGLASASDADHPLPEREESVESNLLLPDWNRVKDPTDSWLKRGAAAAAHTSYSLVNETLSDTWSITKSPLAWRTREWLTLGAIAGVTTGLILLVDDEVRDASIDKSAFQEYGRRIRYIGIGPGLVILSGSFALSGILQERPRELETARLLLEATAVTYGFNLLGKYTFGRARPRTNSGPRDFDPFSGSVSMPSGEATHAFAMAGVLTSQYPHWGVQIASYSVASMVGVGRIALDGHWTSDVFVSAALGIAVSKAIVHLSRRRDEICRRELRRRGAQEPVARGNACEPRHQLQLGMRGLGWRYVF